MYKIHLNMNAVLSAHLSRRLIGELILHPCSDVPLLLSSVDNAQTSMNLKGLDNQNQTLCRNSMGRGIKSFFSISVSHGQDIWPSPCMVKTLQKSSLEPVDQVPRNLVCITGDCSSSLFV